MPITQTTKSDQTIKELVKQLGSEKQEIAFVAYQAILEKILPTTSYQSRRKREHVPMAAQLATEFNAKTEVKPADKKGKKGKQEPPKPLHSTAVRNKVLRLLSYTATDGVLETIRNAFKDLETRQMALYVLCRLTSDRATDLLIEALDQVGPTFRVGVVNALGKRQGEKVLAALKKTATEDPEAQVRIAAVEALANFPEPANDTIIAQAANSDCKHMKAAAHKARVRLAETLRNTDKKSHAVKVYNAILSSNASQIQKKAAKLGLELLE
ncbi:MAG: HEAT repeat domain-containing protein [Planctomycetota bacterium]|nr:MAG: HEAT repeat domain-containing protein [Planctomycetota bacterium]